MGKPPEVVCRAGWGVYDKRRGATQAAVADFGGARRKQEKANAEAAESTEFAEKTNLRAQTGVSVPQRAQEKRKAGAGHSGKNTEGTEVRKSREAEILRGRGAGQKFWFVGRVAGVKAAASRRTPNGR